MMNDSVPSIPFGFSEYFFPAKLRSLAGTLKNVNKVLRPLNLEV